jgi:hypothetical protein
MDYMFSLTNFYNFFLFYDMLFSMQCVYFYDWITDYDK